MAVAVRVVREPRRERVVPTSEAAAVAIRPGAEWDVLPPLTEDEYALLRDDIRARGIQVPLELDESGTLLDGHGRLRAAAELGITTLPVRMRYYPDADAKLRHVLSLNLARRHLSVAQRTELVRWLRGERRWSGPRIAAALRMARSTVYAHLRRLDADGRLEEPARIVGQQRPGDGRPYQYSTRKRGRRPPSGHRSDGPAGRLWVPASAEDELRLLRAATSELTAWAAFHATHTERVPGFAARFASVLHEIASLPPLPPRQRGHTATTRATTTAGRASPRPRRTGP